MSPATSRATRRRGWTSSTRPTSSPPTRRSTRLRSTRPRTSSTRRPTILSSSRRPSSLRRMRPATSRGTRRRTPSPTSPRCRRSSPRRRPWCSSRWATTTPARASTTGASGAGATTSGGSSATAAPRATAPCPRAWSLPMGVTAVELTAGGFHTCARLAPTQAVYCWGRNDLRQLGAGMVLGASTVPVPVAGLLPGPWRLSAGVHHTCASIPSVGVYCWGYNAIGQCGQPTAVATVDPPAPVAGTLGFTASAGRSFTCAYGGERVLCWGANDAGQLGVPSFTGASRATAEPIIRATAGEPYVALYVGGFHRVRAHAIGADGVLGPQRLRADPRRLEPPADARRGHLLRRRGSFAFGAIHQCALATSDRTSPLRCWGYNALGQAGDGARVTTLGPRRRPRLTGAAQLVAAGFNHTCAALANGVVRCWGALEYGQLGNGASALTAAPAPSLGSPTPSGSRPAPISPARCWTWRASAGCRAGVTTRSASSARSRPPPSRRRSPCGTASPRVPSSPASPPSASGRSTGARLGNGAVRCWGYNLLGALGLGTRMDVAYFAAQGTVPLGALRADDLAAGANHSCVVRSDNVVSCWGDDRLGQCGQATPDGRAALPRRRARGERRRWPAAPSTPARSAPTAWSAAGGTTRWASAARRWASSRRPAPPSAVRRGRERPRGGGPPRRAPRVAGGDALLGRQPPRAARVRPGDGPLHRARAAAGARRCHAGGGGFRTHLRARERPGSTAGATACAGRSAPRTSATGARPPPWPCPRA